MFTIKKILSALLLPLPLCGEVLITGLVLLWFTRRQKLGKIVALTGTLMLLLLGNPNITNLLLARLEREYRPFSSDSQGSAVSVASEAKFIVVLGGAYSPDPEVPVTSQLGEDTIVRLVEGIRLYKQVSRCKLVLSGGRSVDPLPNAEIMARMARALRVNQADIILESESRDTEGEARLIEPIVGRDSFILVTSASHMPRSIALFRKLGMNPIAAPTDYLVKQGQEGGPDSLFPSSKGFRKAERAIHEYLGIAWAKLRGKI